MCGYIRVGSHKTKLSEHADKEARLWSLLGHQRGLVGRRGARAPASADLDPEAINAARQRFLDYLLRSEPDVQRHEAIRTEAMAWSHETLLNKARITKLGRITRAALLLLGRDESAHFLAPVDAKISWIPRDASNATLTSQHFGPPFLLATEKAFARIRNLTLDHFPDGTLFPTPGAAVRQLGDARSPAQRGGPPGLPAGREDQLGGAPRSTGAEQPGEFIPGAWNGCWSISRRLSTTAISG
jgi:ATP-dependent DNA helicase RecG